jgi:hypothetical protein
MQRDHHSNEKVLGVHFFVGRFVVLERFKSKSEFKFAIKRRILALKQWPSRVVSPEFKLGDGGGFRLGVQIGKDSLPPVYAAEATVS